MATGNIKEPFASPGFDDQQVVLPKIEKEPNKLRGRVSSRLGGAYHSLPCAFPHLKQCVQMEKRRRLEQRRFYLERERARHCSDKSTSLRRVDTPLPELFCSGKKAPRRPLKLSPISENKSRSSRATDIERFSKLEI